jgi:nitroimidazol reductase NimA-like FMN-containing flavoprotein (pyridoxamine 5'-phosphate oxidase superfamily)
MRHMTTARPWQARLLPLSRQDALELLSSVPLGRIVFTQHALPAIRPVNHMVDSGQVIICTHDGAAILGNAGNSAVVAYEADQLDPDTRTGWSVIVTGTANLVRDPARLATYHQELAPWVGSEMNQVIRISPDLVTGYLLAAE